jgi:hypothetical protein
VRRAELAAEAERLVEQHWTAIQTHADRRAPVAKLA